MLGATIIVNDKKIHTFNDWQLKWSVVEISSPSPKTYMVDIPGADGQLDLTESLTGDVKYDNRKIKLSFVTSGDYREWSSISSFILNFLHGKVAKIILDIDANFYYIGRLTLSSDKDDFVFGELILTGDIDPFKYEIDNSINDWTWDGFSFLDGIIREYKDLIVDKKLIVNIPGRRKTIYPKIISSAPMKLNFNGKDYDLPIGTVQLLDSGLTDGDNILTFTGNGIVSIEYRGGSL